MNLTPTSSTTAALAVGATRWPWCSSSLWVSSGRLRGAAPARSLGWRALFRVADLMLTGDAPPIVPESTPLRDVIVEMTQAQRHDHRYDGPAGSSDADGDLRRLHLTGKSIDDLSAGQVASREPKTIRARTSRPRHSR